VVAAAVIYVEVSESQDGWTPALRGSLVAKQRARRIRRALASA